MLKNCGLEQKYRNFNFFVHSSHLSLLLFFRNYALLLSLYPCGLACWKRHRSPHIFSIDEVASQSSSCFAFFGQHLNNGVFETSLTQQWNLPTSRQRHRRDADNSTSESEHQKPDEKQWPFRGRWCRSQCRDWTFGNRPVLRALWRRPDDPWPGRRRGYSRVRLIKVLVSILLVVKQ